MTITTPRNSKVEVGELNCDFVVELPKTKKNNDVMQVVVDRLTKKTHFIPVKMTIPTICETLYEQYCQIAWYTYIYNDLQRCKVYIQNMEGI